MADLTSTSNPGSSIGKSCDSCMFFRNRYQALDGERGECCRKAPDASQMPGSTHRKFPTLAPSEWCGDHIFRDQEAVKAWWAAKAAKAKAAKEPTSA